MSAEADEARGEKRGDPWRKAALAVVVLVAIIVIPQWWFRMQYVPVPAVIGLSRAAAEQRIRQAGFDVGTSTRTLAMPGERIGLVVQQSPSAGGRQMRGSGVDIIIADAAEETSTPGGDTAPILSDSYLNVPDEGRKTDDVHAAPDSPPVQSGPQVPQVLERSSGEASGILGAAGYGVTVANGTSSTAVPRGRVYRQDPAPGSYEPRGTTVTIWVSSGSP